MVVGVRDKSAAGHWILDFVQIRRLVIRDSEEEILGSEKHVGFVGRAY